MVQLECFRIEAQRPSNFISYYACEQNLEVALLVHAIFFGFSLSVAALCFYHLIKRFQRRASHIIILTFSTLLLIANIMALVFIAQSFHTYIHFLLASSAIQDYMGPAIDDLSKEIQKRAFIQDLYLPIFLWVTDAFLLYRAWVIWQGRRLALILPFFIFFGSLISGIVCQALFATTEFLETPWIPALSFSSAVDVITTSMIAGRLCFYHRRQRKLGISDSTFFVSALVICVESGLMSTISKLLQFAIPISDRALSVVPLVTIASNLIILRKALGSDIVQSMTRTNAGQLSEIRFGSRVMPNSNRDYDHTSGAVATIHTSTSPASIVDAGRSATSRKAGEAGASSPVDSVIDASALHGEEGKRVFGEV